MIVTLDVCEYANSRFIIDTGAMTSIIKYNDIRKGTMITRDSSRFYGLIKDQYVKAVGKVTTNMALNGIVLKHTFYIIQEEINIASNGIIGADFLRKYNAEIQYSKRLIKLQVHIDSGPGFRKDATTSTDDIDFYRTIDIRAFEAQSSVMTDVLDMDRQPSKIKQEIIDRIFKRKSEHEKRNMDTEKIELTKETEQIPEGIESIATKRRKKDISGIKEKSNEKGQHGLQHPTGESSRAKDTKAQNSEHMKEKIQDVDQPSHISNEEIKQKSETQDILFKKERDKIAGLYQSSQQSSTESCSKNSRSKRKKGKLEKDKGTEDSKTMTETVLKPQAIKEGKDNETRGTSQEIPGKISEKKQQSPSRKRKTKLSELLTDTKINEKDPLYLTPEKMNEKFPKGTFTLETKKGGEPPKLPTIVENETTRSSTSQSTEPTGRNNRKESGIKEKIKANKKVINRGFYDELPDTYFDNFPVVTPRLLIKSNETAGTDLLTPYKLEFPFSFNEEGAGIPTVDPSAAGVQEVILDPAPPPLPKKNEDLKTIRIKSHVSDEEKMGLTSYQQEIDDIDRSIKGCIRKIIGNCESQDTTSGDEIRLSRQRMEYLQNKVNLAHCEPEQRVELLNVLRRHCRVFQLPGDQFRHTDIDEHQIILKPNTTPINQRQFRIPEHYRGEVQRQIDDMEKRGIISPCDSPWNSPIFLVPKKANEKGEKQYRLVIDYRELNKVIEPTAYPMPQIDEIIDKLKGCKYFATLDMFGAYHQVPLEKRSRQYTAFSTSYEKYCFNSIPFGLVSSPFAWLKVINKIMTKVHRRIKEEWVDCLIMVYMDDLLAGAKRFADLVRGLDILFEELGTHYLKLNPEKSKFLTRTVAYLGFIITTEGLSVDPKKTECIRKYPEPKTVKQIQTFMGMCNYYRRYIEDYAGLARPLYNLCRKDEVYVWTEECQNAFDQFKERLSNPPILIFPDFTQPFILRTDCSMLSASGILSQGEIPNDRPIHYFSKVLNSAQTRYSTVEKELLAIILSVEYFHYYLIGREFMIITDHRPLTYLFENKNISARLHRWRYALMSYQFKIIYKPGKGNTVADALSRVQIEPDNENEECGRKLEYDVFKIRALTRGQRARQEQEARQEEEQQALNQKPQQVPKNSSATSDETTNEERGSEICQQEAVHPPPIEKDKCPEQKHKLPFIAEKRNMAINNTDYDFIFYIISRPNDKIHKKLQHKLKQKIELNEIPPNELCAIDKDKAIVLSDSRYRTSEEITEARSLLQIIHQFCSENGYENVAINIQFRDQIGHVEFRHLIQEIFRASTISITLHSNEIMEVTSLEEIDNIISMYHDSVFGGHNGVERTLKNIKHFYHWLGMDSDVKRYIQNCAICEKTKIKTHTKSPMVITTVATHPFQKIYVDIVGPITPTSRNGNIYILTCNCSLTKYVIAAPMADTTALTTAKNLVHSVFLKYGLPELFVTDNGTNFISETLKEVNKLFKIKKVFTTPYHPQSNQIERFHRTLGNYMKAFVQNEQDLWCEYLDFATFAYNNSTNQSTGYAPFELVFGRKAKLPTEITNRTVPMYNYDNYAQELRNKLKHYHDLAREYTMQGKEVNKKKYDQGRDQNILRLQKNDLVLILNPNKKGKFDTPYEGPYRVIEEQGPVTILIKRKNKEVKIHKDRVKLATADYSGAIPPLLE